jgi:ring-1,2-phenylacetyl-CoA epoxidase subunit PaaE
VSGLHFHRLKVARIAADTDDARIVSFDVPAALRDEFTFAPGQYLTLRSEVGGEDLRRSYSICAAPADGALRVGVRRVPGGRFSNWLHSGLREGDELDVLPPQGRFVVPPAGNGAPRHLLCVAGGSGITPIIAILKSTLAAEPATHATLVYANRRVASTMFKEELQDLKNRHLARFALVPLYSREAVGDSELLAGRLDGAKLDALLDAGVIHLHPDTQAFVCGPSGMNDALAAALARRGLSEAQIHVERFGVPDSAGDAHLHDAQPGDAEGAQLIVERDGRRHALVFAPGTPSILDAAAAAGIDVPYSCKSGVCATCRAKVLDGRVRMDRNFALPADELAAGFVLTCQAHPLTERVVVSYDER